MAYAGGYEYLANKIGDDCAKIIYEFLLPEKIKMNSWPLHNEINWRIKRCGECQKLLSESEREDGNHCDNCHLIVCENCYDKYSTGGYLDICDICIQEYDPDLPWVLERRRNY